MMAAKMGALVLLSLLAFAQAQPPVVHVPGDAPFYSAEVSVSESTGEFLTRFQSRSVS
jgi:hypothetical protein